MATRRSLTVRLPEPLYLASVELAERRGKSLNALVQEALAALAREEEHRRLYDEFSLIAEDAGECDVEFAMPAQSEVVLSDTASDEPNPGTG